MIKKDATTGNKEINKLAPKPQIVNPSGGVSTSSPAGLNTVSNSSLSSLAEKYGIGNVPMPAPSGGTTSGVYVPRINYTNKSQAEAYINSAYKALGLDRQATELEVNVLTKELNKIEKANPKTRTTNAAGQYEYAGGVKPDQEIKNILTSAKPSAAVKKLGLPAEIAKAQATLGTIAKEKLDTATQKLLATARANGLDLTQSQIDNYKTRLDAGETIDALNQDIRKIAALGMPENVKSLVTAGSNLEDVYSPYRQVMANTLEIPLDQINVNDPTLRSAISPTGEMPIYDFQNALRKDPRWQYTNNAKKAVADSVQKILQDFGFMG